MLKVNHVAQSVFRIYYVQNSSIGAELRSATDEDVSEPPGIALEIDIAKRPCSHHDRAFTRKFPIDP